MINEELAPDEEEFLDDEVMQIYTQKEKEKEMEPDELQDWGISESFDEFDDLPEMPDDDEFGHWIEKDGPQIRNWFAEVEKALQDNPKYGFKELPFSTESDNRGFITAQWDVMNIHIALHDEATSDTIYLESTANFNAFEAEQLLKHYIFDRY